jgi:hypothetical protein
LFEEFLAEAFIPEVELHEDDPDALACFFDR